MHYACGSTIGADKVMLELLDCANVRGYRLIDKARRRWLKHRLMNRSTG